MHDSKPQWFIDHEASDERHFKEIKDILLGQNKTLKPIADAYLASGKIGKWGMALLVVIATIAGIILTVKSIVKL